MKHPIGFCVQPRAPEAASPTPAAQPEAAAVPSVVRVYFPERDRAYSYYNDRFDLHEGDVVYVSGKLAGLLGRVAAVDYNFRIRLADYERVIGAADQEPCAARFTCSARTCSRSITARCRMRRCAAGFSRRRPDGEFVTGHGPGPTYTLDFLDQMPLPGETAGKGHACYAEGRVVYLSVDGTQGHTIVQGTVPHELTFTYTAARSARSRAPVTRRDCASTVRRCCCSCARRSTSSARSTRRRLLRAIGSPP